MPIFALAIMTRTVGLIYVGTTLRTANFAI